MQSPGAVKGGVIALTRTAAANGPGTVFGLMPLTLAVFAQRALNVFLQVPGAEENTAGVHAMRRGASQKKWLMRCAI